MSKSAARTARYTCMVALFLSAADLPWKDKPAAQWSVDDAKLILRTSPWVKTVEAGIARRQSEDELREGGRMGQPRGVGYDGVDPKGSGPKLPTNITDIFTPGDDRSPRSMPREVSLTLRWESALPVRLAELKAGEAESPATLNDVYAIGVYGVPGGNFKGDPKQLGEPLKREAVLKREGKKDVKPASVEVFQRSDGLLVIYMFPLSAEITKRDGYVVFDAHIGRVVVSHAFNLAEMEFLGKLEL
jgi:hypothetical protein